MLYIAGGALSALIFLLCLKIWLLHKGIREITDELDEILREDTNTLLTVSSRDRSLLYLADKLNAQLRLLGQARLKYQQGDRELKNAVTNISHDLRTPLTAVNGYLELLAKEPHTLKTLRHMEIIRTRVEDMKQLTEELFRYSVALSLKETRPRLLSLNRHLEESILGFYGALRQKNIIPLITLPDTPVMRTLDDASLSRIFNNIISNAIKYSDGDFQVSLTPDGTITFCNTAKNLNPISTARLFDRFYTAETIQDSTGLGLSIAKHLTEHLGGSITAQYRDDKLWIIINFPDCRTLPAS